MRALGRTDWAEQAGLGRGDQTKGRGDREESVRGIREAARITEVAIGNERVAASRCLPSGCVLQSWGCKPSH